MFAEIVPAPVERADAKPPIVIDCKAKHITFDGHEFDQVAPGVYKPCEPYLVRPFEWCQDPKHMGCAFIVDNPDGGAPYGNDEVELRYFAIRHGWVTLTHITNELDAKGEKVWNLIYNCSPFAKPEVIWRT